MKQIKKRTSQPDFLRDWKSNFRQNRQKSATYNDLTRDNATYKSLKQELLQEQYFLCCYCCNRIVQDTSSSHIEHFVPRSVEPSMQLDYHNLFTSCNGYIQDISTVDHESCGHMRGNWHDRNLIIHPTDPTCEQVFEFLFDGRIVSKNNEPRASKMIEKFQLDTYALKKAREIAINIALESVTLPDGTISDEIIADELSFNTRADNAGQLPPFCDAVSYVLKSL